MNQFDAWMEDRMSEFNIGKRRGTDPRWRRLTNRGMIKEAHAQNISSGLAKDPRFKRMRYVRYADDFLIGIIGSREDCVNIRNDIATFLKDQLKLELSMEKTKITHSTTEAAMFLGSNISLTPQKRKPFRKVIRGDQTYLMKSNTMVQLQIPIGRIVDRLEKKGIVRHNRQPTRWGKMTLLNDSQIVNHMFTMYRGLANYYSFASNFNAMSRIYYILKYSCALTLANKHKLGTMKKVFKKYGKDLNIIKDEKVVASFPKVSFANQTKFNATLREHISPLVRLERLANAFFRTSERLNSACMICSSTERVEMHHVKHIRQVTEKIIQDYWTRVMALMNRKQIAVCRDCHIKIHNGEYNGVALNKIQELQEKKGKTNLKATMTKEISLHVDRPASQEPAEKFDWVSHEQRRRENMKEYINSAISDFDIDPTAARSKGGGSGA